MFLYVTDKIKTYHKIGIAEKRVVSHEQIIGISPSTGRTRDDHGLGNGSSGLLI